jgi:predicted lipoprotein with Yx(FWY)xxD motif
MSSTRSSSRRRLSLLSVALFTTALAAFAVAALSASALSKASDTIGVAKSVKITTTSSTTRAAIAVNSRGIAVYELIPETVNHPLCTKANGCEAFWFPVTVKSANTKLTKAAGLKGKLGVWHREGFFQVTLGGHPLYTFVMDKGKKGIAKGEGLHGFNGVWHVIRSSSAGISSSSGTTDTTPTMTTPTTSTPSYPGY